MNKAIAAACLALMMVAMAFALLSDPQEVDGSLQEGDTYRIHEQDYYVVLAGKMYTNASLGEHTRIYIIGNGTSEVRDGAFQNCTRISSVYLGGDVTAIGDRAFAGTTNLNNFTGSQVETIGAEAFLGSGLRTVSFGNGLTSIGDDAFRNCTDFKTFRFHDTSVTSIGSGVFMNSGLEIIDLRNVTSVHPDAFTNGQLRLQIVGKTQTATVIGVDRLFYDADGEDLYQTVGCINGTVTIYMWDTKFVTLTEAGGGEVGLTYTDPVGVEYHARFVPEAGRDYVLELSKAEISFPDDLGYEAVYLEPGTDEYVLPTDPLGDLDLLYWQIEGIEGEFQRVDTEALTTLAGKVSVVPCYGNAVLTLDHSGVSGLADASGLATQAYFTYRTAYPDMPDLTGYEFDGWDVDGTRYSAGDTITTYASHTAVSLWRPTLFHDLIYLGPSGEPVATVPQGYNQTVTVDPDIVTDGAPGQRFVGWSLDGSTVLTPEDGIRMADDVTLLPVFEDRAEFTVKYVVDGEEVSSATGFDGREFAVSEDVPTSDMVFVQWVDRDGGEFPAGSSFVLTGDVTLTAEWRARISVTVTFSDGKEVLATDYAREGIPYTVELVPEIPEDRVFDGWMDPDGDVVSPGDEITAFTDITMTLVTHERARFTVTYVTGEGTVSAECLEGSMHMVDADVPEADGKVFAGWTGQDGTLYEPGTEITVLGDVVLTATWRDPARYTVTFVDPYGETRTAEKTEGVPFEVGLSCEDTETHIFDHWTTAEGGKVEVGGVLTYDGDATLTAAYRERAGLILTFKDGSSVLGTASAVEGIPLEITQADPASNDGTFVCWTDPEGRPYVKGDDVTLWDDMVLQATWKAHDGITVTYKDGDRVVAVRTGVSGEPMRIDVGDPVSTVRVFLQWLGSDGGRYSLGDPIVPKGDMTLTAQWRDALMFTITFMDGRSVLGSATCVEGSAATIVQPVPTDHAREFSHWTDGITEYRTGDRISPTSDVVLTAVWMDVETHRITYVSDGKTVLTAKVRDGTEHTVTLSLSDTDTEEFLGWSTTDDGTADYVPGDRLTPAADVTLHAVWGPLEDREDDAQTDGGSPDDGEEPDGQEGPSDPSGPDPSEGSSSGTEPQDGDGGPGIQGMTALVVTAGVVAAVAAMLVVMVRRS